jgi:L-ribulose-5-phosphate 3-epimerase
MDGIAVCSWSLQPKNPRELVDRVFECGLSAVQLALDPIRTGVWNEAETVKTLSDAGVRMVSGMMATKGEDYSSLRSIRETGGFRPDATWEANREAAKANADLAARLGLDLVTLHAGFIPQRRSDPDYWMLIERLQEVADIFQERSVRIGLETGQENANGLLGALDDLERRSVGVNFDPANMILYGMGDPVPAMERLAPRIVQIHIKDGIASAKKDEWGTEVAVGDGEVDWRAFFGVFKDRVVVRDIVIEREAGEQRVEDVRQAVELVRFYSGRGA